MTRNPGTRNPGTRSPGICRPAAPTLALLGALAAVGVLVATAHPAATTVASPAALLPSLPPTGSAVVAVPSGRLPQARPVALVAPSIGLAVSGVTELHRDAGGLLQTPAPGTAGWSTLGPTPGARGPAVITAHETSGPFARIAELAAGDEVTVAREDGTNAVFTVYRVDRFPRAAFPRDDVYGETPTAELRLVTSGGIFDRNAGPDAANVVAFARLAGVR